jgi:hypothetical protein
MLQPCKPRDERSESHASPAGFAPLILRLGLLVPLLVVAGCASDGHFDLLGYTTRPTYDDCIRTVYVPIFENVSFRRGLEFDLTRAVIREIEAKTPYKVASCREAADTELRGKIINRNKALILNNQLNEIREGEVALAVELTWLDLRPGHLGEVLTRPDAPRGEILRGRDNFGRFGFNPVTPPSAMEEQPRGAPLIDKEGKPLPVLVQPTATYVPELGGSVTSAEKQLVDRLAIQIVSMMERPW